MVEWTNPCDGFMQRPTTTRRTSLDLGSKFGGMLLGCCPVEGCEAIVGRNGRLKKHNQRPGEFARNLAASRAADAASRRRGVDPNDPRHLD